jgi:drug/metabolite transporter (DMT)-like permease
MTLTAILLILSSAVIHAGWNLLSKRSRPTASFFLAAVITSIVLYSPIGWGYGEALAHFPVWVWALLALTGGFQALYYAGLAGAYRSGELSVVYPLARALPVLLVAGVSLLLGRGAQITPLGLAGMVLVAVGCWVLPQQVFSLNGFALPVNRSQRIPQAAVPGRSGFPALHNPAIFLAILAALGTTGYTLIDDAALSILRAAPLELSKEQTALLYLYIENCSILIWLAGFVLASPAERVELRSFGRSVWLTAALAGVLILAAYGLVLAAMAYVRDVSYVSAFRQVSIPLGAILGMAVEKEKAYPPKIAGIVLIAVGLALVAGG